MAWFFALMFGIVGGIPHPFDTPGGPVIGMVSPPAVTATVESFRFA